MQFFRFKRFEFLVSIGCLAMLGYFAWQAERGPRGFAYQSTLTEQLQKLSTQLEKIKDEHNLLEARVAELRPDAIDPDLLDEMARRNLGYVSPDQVVVHFSN
jgi:cell division protein FtsB